MPYDDQYSWRNLSSAPPRVKAAQGLPRVQGIELVGDDIKARLRRYLATPHPPVRLNQTLRTLCEAWRRSIRDPLRHMGISP